MALEQHIATGAGGLGFDSQDSQMRTQGRQCFATAATFLWEMCCPSAKSRRWPRLSLRTSTMQNTASTMKI